MIGNKGNSTESIMCKIAILENYSLFCSGIKAVLNQLTECDIIAEAKKVNDLLPQIKKIKPDVIIVDVIHCNSEGIIQIKRIKRNTRKTPILLIIDKDYISHFEEYMALGIKGLILNDSGAPELLTAVKKLKNGEDYFPQKVWLLLKNFMRKQNIDELTDKYKLVLTTRETEVLKLFCKGLSYKEVASELDISHRTVESHKKNISSKINVHSTVEMVHYAVEHNLHI